MEPESTRDRAVRETRTRILDVALEVLGRSPDAGMGDIAAAAGVVRRTVYGHFPARADLVRALAQQAADELAAILTGLDDGRTSPDEVWAAYVARLWPLAARYRVLLALRRGEHGEDIHALLRPAETTLAGLVRRGQRTGVFGRHLPAEVLGQLAQATVFTLADGAGRTGSAGGRGAPGVAAATETSLLLFGVPQDRARALLPTRRR